MCIRDSDSASLPVCRLLLPAAYSVYEYDVPKRGRERKSVFPGIASKRHLLHSADLDPPFLHGAGGRADCPDGSGYSDLCHFAAAFDTIFTEIGDDK